MCYPREPQPVSPDTPTVNPVETAPPRPFANYKRLNLERLESEIIEHLSGQHINSYFKEMVREVQAFKGIPETETPAEEQQKEIISTVLDALIFSLAGFFNTAKAQSFGPTDRWAFSDYADRAFTVRQAYEKKHWPEGTPVGTTPTAFARSELLGLLKASPDATGDDGAGREDEAVNF